MPRPAYPSGPNRRPGRRLPPLPPMAKLLMDAACLPHGHDWPPLSRDEAEHYALEWARGWFTPDGVKQWLDAGASPSDARGAVALRDVGVPPNIGCLPLFDDETLRPGGIPLVSRVTLGNISVEAARALLQRTGHLPTGNPPRTT
jgi:hypothetical protein